MSTEKKTGLSAEPAGGEPKAGETKGQSSLPVISSEPKGIVQKLTGSMLRGLSTLLDSVIVMDAIKLFGWIGSIIIVAGVCWMLTQPVRNRFLMRAVNRVLEQYGDFRRLAELSSNNGSVSLIGSWYTMIKVRQQGISGNYNFSEGTKAFVFSFIAEGTFFPCAAVVDPEGKVLEFIPLNIHGKKTLERISPGIIKLYKSRIEGS